LKEVRELSMLGIFDKSETADYIKERIGYET